MVQRALWVVVIVAWAAVAVAACVSQTPVPLRDGAFPRGAVQVGEDVRLTTRSGEALGFKVTGVEDGALTGAGGERVEAGELASLEVRRVNRRSTIILASVLGGIVGTALIYDAVEDDLDCLEFDRECDD
jgi:hypothetical protein